MSDKCLDCWAYNLWQYNERKEYREHYNKLLKRALQTNREPPEKYSCMYFAKPKSCDGPFQDEI